MNKHDRADNLITVCTDCHTYENHQKGNVLWKWMIEGKKLPTFKEGTFMNIFRRRVFTHYPDARFTHIPTGIVISCQDEKSQLKNKDKAMKILKTRLYDLKLSEQNAEIADMKRGQVGTGDRSERIRTYNFPQGRVTDHRINLTLHKINSFIDGDLDEMIETLITTDQAQKLQQIE